MTRALVLAALLTALGGCTTVAVAPVAAPPLDLALTRACDPPVAIPPRDLDERSAVRLWGADRLALKDCGRRFAAATAITERRDAALAGR